MYSAWSHCQGEVCQAAFHWVRPLPMSCQMLLIGNETVQDGTLWLPFLEKFGKDASTISRSGT